MKKIILILFIITAITVSVGWFYYERNIFSTDDVRFEIIAPQEVRLGEVVDYKVYYKNNGDIRLEDAKLVFEYPENSFPEEEENDDIVQRGELRREVDLGNIGPGEERSIDFSARLFGKEREAIIAEAWISYIPRNLNVSYETEREHTAIITSVPINFDFEIPSSVEPEKENLFRLRYFSNVDYTLTNMEARVEFPSDFTYTGSSPKKGEDNEWNLPVLNRGEGGVIEIEGSLEGEPRDPKVFRAVLGIWRGNTFIPIKETSRGTSIARPSLFISMEANEYPDYVANPGELVYYEIFFKNIGEESMENLFLMIDLDRSVVDFEEVEPLKGRFQAGTLIWSHTADPYLRYLASGEEGSLSFWAKIREDLPTNPELKLDITLDRATETFVTQINTKLEVMQEVSLQSEHFEERGPFPFEEGVPTNYTVRFVAKNHFTDTEDLRVRATLPEGAKITGETYPEDMSLSFDSESREVVWDIETLEKESERELFFEVTLTPEDDVEELISEAVITGEDMKTEKIVSGGAESLTVEDL